MALSGWAEHPRFLLVFRLLVALLASLPLLFLVSGILGRSLGPDPGQAVTESLGIAAFQLLIATLAMTPLRRWTGWGGWIRIRRMLGLLAFFYAVLHVLAFLQFILGWTDLWVTFTKRPYIIAGALSFVMLVPLALTSTKGMMKRLGRSWKQLHKLVYTVVVVAWVHFVWQARSDVGEMAIYGVLVLFLLVVRWKWGGVRSMIPFVRG